MSNYYHGAKASKQATSVSTPVVADSSIHLIVGTAPVHTVGGKVNEPVYASNYAEAVAAMGYSDEWDKYDICEEIYSSFKLYSNGPIIMVSGAAKGCCEPDTNSHRSGAHFSQHQEHY